MNILILTGRFGMGHYSAAITLSQDIKKKYPHANIIVRDIFEAIAPNHFTSLYKSYTWLVNNAGWCYNSYYKLTERSHKNVRPPMMFTLFSIFNRLLAAYEPTLIFSTLPMCSQLASQYKKRFYAPFSLITCVTDISAHNEWINDETDYYMVGSCAVKEQLEFRNVSEDKIYITGIPVKSEFRAEHPSYISSKKHLLIMGGGLGLIPTAKNFYRRLNELENVKTTVILGNNKELYDALHGVYKNIEVVGYTDKVCDYMLKADALLSKPGGITMFETIHSRLPILVLSPFLEQEIKNANFIENRGIGKVFWDKSADPIICIERFLSDNEEISRIRRKMESFTANLETDALEKIIARAMLVHTRIKAEDSVLTATLMPRKGVLA